jgi:hypothetical protein
LFHFIIGKLRNTFPILVVKTHNRETTKDLTDVGRENSSSENDELHCHF